MSQLIDLLPQKLLYYIFLLHFNFQVDIIQIIHLIKLLHKNFDVFVFTIMYIGISLLN